MKWIVYDLAFEEAFGIFSSKEEAIKWLKNCGLTDEYLDDLSSGEVSIVELKPTSDKIIIGNEAPERQT